VLLFEGTAASGSRPIHGDDRDRQLLQLRLDLSRHRFAVASPRNIKHLPPVNGRHQEGLIVSQGFPEQVADFVGGAAAAFEEPDQSVSIEHVPPPATMRDT
jgi:hypothetical protein